MKYEVGDKWIMWTDNHSSIYRGDVFEVANLCTCGKRAVGAETPEGAVVTPCRIGTKEVFLFERNGERHEPNREICDLILQQRAISDRLRELMA